MAPQPYFQFIPTFFEDSHCCVRTTTRPTIIGELLQQQNNIFFQESLRPFLFLFWFGFFWGEGGCLGFYFLGVLGVSFFFGMASSLGPLLVQDTPCPHCFGLYILSGFSRHVKSVHLLVNSIS